MNGKKLSATEVADVIRTFEAGSLIDQPEDFRSTFIGTPSKPNLCNRAKFELSGATPEEILVYKHCKKLTHFIEIDSSIRSCVFSSDRNLGDRLSKLVGQVSLSKVSCSPRHSYTDDMHQIFEMTKLDRNRKLQEMVVGKAMLNTAELDWRLQSRFGDSKLIPSSDFVDERVANLCANLYSTGGKVVCTSELQEQVKTRLIELEQSPYVPQRFQKLDEVAEALNLSYMHLNSKLDEIKAPSTKWSGGPDRLAPEVKSAYTEYAREWGRLAQTDLGALIQSDVVKKNYGDFRLDQENFFSLGQWTKNASARWGDKPEPWKLPPHGGIDLSDRKKAGELIAVASQQSIARVKKEFQLLAELDNERRRLQAGKPLPKPDPEAIKALRKSNPTAEFRVIEKYYEGSAKKETPELYEDHLVKLLKTNPKAFAEVLIEHPEYSGQVCELIGAVQRADKQAQKSDEYAQVFLAGGLATMAVGGAVAFFAPPAGAGVAVVGKATAAVGTALAVYEIQLQAQDAAKLDTMIDEATTAIVLQGGDPDSPNDIAEFSSARFDKVSDKGTGTVMTAVGVVPEIGGILKIKNNVFRLTPKGELSRLRLVAGAASNPTVLRTEDKFPVLASLVESEESGLFLAKMKTAKTYSNTLEELKVGTDAEKRVYFLMTQKGDAGDEILNLFKKFKDRFQLRDGGSAVFTDTEYTSKFGFPIERTTQKVSAIAKSSGVNLEDLNQELKLSLRTPGAFEKNRDVIAKTLSTKNDKKSIEKFLSLISEDEFEEGKEGVIRFRKHLSAPAADAIDVPGPATRALLDDPVNSATVRDAAFRTPETTSIEFKMKNASANPNYKTAIDKLRLDVPDALVADMQNPANYSKETFKEFKGRVLEQAKKVRQPKENLEKFDEFMDMMKATKKMDMSPTGRIVYKRTGFRGFLEDGSEFQITVDADVLQLDRVTGEVRQAYPWVDKTNNRVFQFDAKTGEMVHVDAKDRVTHVLDPKEKKVWRVQPDGKRVLETGSNVTPIKQVETKIPPKYAGFTDKDLSKVPSLQHIRNFQNALVDSNQELNRLRASHDLSEMGTNRGKASVFRTGAGGRAYKRVLQTPKGNKELLFSHHPHSNKFIHWEGKKAVYELDIKTNRVYELVDGKIDRGAAVSTRKP